MKNKKSRRKGRSSKKAGVSMRGERHGARERDIVQVNAVVQLWWGPSMQQLSLVQ